VKALPRFLVYAGLWLLLSGIFASQLYLAGYVRPWTRAFTAEAIYWLSWSILLPALFWACRRLRPFSWRLRVPMLLLGALVAVLAVPLVSRILIGIAAPLGLCPGDCEQPGALFSAQWFHQVVRVAGVNLPVYAGFVLAWHAATFYRESRDRQVQAAQLESLLHQAQLDALRSQLNPHFLFNALHSMAELVHTDPKLAEQLIVRLGELLRQVLQSSTRHESSLAEELEFIRGYVEIEQMRLGDRLSVKWEIDPAVLDARVPGLILQPLVENAVQHGIAATTAPGTLTIRAWREVADLCLEVHDTGRGPDASVSRPSNGVGLSNTRARLERQYGNRHGFELRNGNGFAVRLRLPALPA